MWFIINLLLFFVYLNLKYICIWRCVHLTFLCKLEYIENIIKRKAVRFFVFHLLKTHPQHQRIILIIAHRIRILSKPTEYNNRRIDVRRTDRGGVAIVFVRRLLLLHTLYGALFTTVRDINYNIVYTHVYAIIDLSSTRRLYRHTDTAQSFTVLYSADKQI